MFRWTTWRHLCGNFYYYYAFVTLLWPLLSSSSLSFDDPAVVVNAWIVPSSSTTVRSALMKGRPAIFQVAAVATHKSDTEMNYPYDPAAAASSATAASPTTNTNNSYETALAEMESEVLYGTTPKMCDLDQLAGWVRRNRLDLSPKYQRGYVWKEDKASRLIVTALCNRIVPGIVLHEVQKGTYAVVDGKQRLTTLLGFYLAGEDPELFQKLCEQFQRVHSSSSKPLINNGSGTFTTGGGSGGGLFTTLRKLDENYEDLEGLTYAQLSKERQDALQSYTIPCTIIPYGTPKEEVFSCYEDINSGGIDLKAQQLRRAVFYGDYIDLLDRLALNADFQCIREPNRFRKHNDNNKNHQNHNPQALLCPHESDRELILRAFAWSRNHLKYKRPLKTFLNAELQHYESMKKGNVGVDALSLKELQQREEEFIFIMRVWRNVFSEDDGAFRAWVPSSKGNSKSTWSWAPKITVGFWDVMYTVLVELRHLHPTEPVYMQNKEALKRAIQELFETEKLEVTSTVTIKKFLNRRNTIRRALLKVLDGASPTKRMFSHSKILKEQLFHKQNGQCSICGHAIDERRLNDGSYVHLDHVVPFSKGGASSKENAALAHAACNLSKGAKTEQHD